MSRHQVKGRSGHAVVIGASMAGLSIGGALATAFDRVTLVDRDTLPDGTEHRKGVPQGRHLHVLLTAGSDALDGIFPGLVAELIADGAVTGDLGQRGRTIVNGQRLARGPFGRDDVLASRPFVEGHVRRRVQADPAVVFERAQVRALLLSADRRQVVGVEIMPRDGGGTARALEADLVVDCSGRRSPVPGWLGELGYTLPPIDELRVDVAYATRHYRLSPGVLAGDLFTLITPESDLPKGGGLARMEGDRCVVTLIGMGGEQPPLDADGFETYASTLSTSDIYDAIRQGTALDEPVGFRYATNRRHRYERLRKFPNGLLVAGDAVCSFNPIYGQGMTVAALEALALRRLLAETGVPTAQTWFRSIEAIVDPPWDMAIGGDLAIRCIEGQRSVPVRVVNHYMDRFYRAAVHDPVLSVMFGRVSSLLDPPTRLLHPATLARVLRGNLRSPRPPRERSESPIA